MWKKLFSPYNTAFPFFMSGIAVLLINLLLVGWTRWEFMYAIPYGLALVALSLVIVSNKPDILSGLISTALTVMVIFTSIGLLNATWSALISFILFVALILNILKVFKYKTNTSVRWITTASMVFLIIWIAIYFAGRLTNQFAEPLNLATIIYHFGVVVISGIGIPMIAVSDRKKHKIATMISIVGLAMIVLGALWLAAPPGIGYGWGLNLVQ